MKIDNVRKQFKTGQNILNILWYMENININVQ